MGLVAIPVNRLIAAKMPEDRGADSLEANLRRLMKDYGLWGYHPYSSLRSEPGWPDWCILGPAGALFRELKSETGTVSPAQRRVGRMMTTAGLNWSVWRPRDLLSRRIHNELASIAAHPELPLEIETLLNGHTATCTCPDKEMTG